ncbi:uncharacterized protein LODBEIA_P45150 [Lodderomyces beijingensis]|uniref:Hyaluronan/mRNA-binding protein domain-containing protein n=1 Tax=Lodderomyces beijingensis TaxID=1775926 RepID=A0ABP0ZTJ1_9ASCO
MSKTKKWTTKSSQASEPKWFTHNGHYNTDPAGVKKNGAGKNNWGQAVDDVNLGEYNRTTTAGRRNSNHEMNELRMNSLNDLVDQQFS